MASLLLMTPNSLCIILPIVFSSLNCILMRLYSLVLILLVSFLPPVVTLTFLHLPFLPPFLPFSLRPFLPSFQLPVLPRSLPTTLQLFARDITRRLRDSEDLLRSLSPFTYRFQITGVDINISLDLVSATYVHLIHLHLCVIVINPR
jgi:hypothetical protein